MENSERSALGYASKASQNIHLVTPHGIDSIKVDLQTTDEVEGYDCSDAINDSHPSCSGIDTARDSACVSQSS